MKSVLLFLFIFITLASAACSNYYVGNDSPLPTLDPAADGNNEGGESDELKDNRHEATVGVLNIDTYFPLDTNNYAMSKFLYLVYDPLVKMDSNFDLSFCLADNVTTADGGITWSVDLRKNVKWHNGNNLCADDIIYTIEYIKAADSRYSSHIKDIYQIDVISDSALSIRLSEADSTFPSKLTFPIIKKDSKNDIFPCGTGMYKFRMVKENGNYVFELNQQYFGKKAGINNIVFASYRTEKELSESNSDFMLIDKANVYNSVISGKHAYFSQGSTICCLVPSTGIESGNPDIRKAIANVLNVEEIIKVSISGYGETKKLQIPDNTWFMHDDEMHKPAGYEDITLDSLGYFSPISITICADAANREHVATAKKCAEQLNRAGFIADYVTYNTEQELENINYSYLVADKMIGFTWDFSHVFAEIPGLSYNITAIRDAYMKPNETGVVDLPSFRQYMSSQMKSAAEYFFNNQLYIGLYASHSALLVDEDINGRSGLTVTGWDPLLGFENLY